MNTNVEANHILTKQKKVDYLSAFKRQMETKEGFWFIVGLLALSQVFAVCIWLITQLEVWGILEQTLSLEEVQRNYRIALSTSITSLIIIVFFIFIHLRDEHYSKIVKEDIIPYLASLPVIQLQVLQMEKVSTTIERENPLAVRHMTGDTEMFWYLAYIQTEGKIEHAYLQLTENYEERLENVAVNVNRMDADLNKEFKKGFYNAQVEQI